VAIPGHSLYCTKVLGTQGYSDPSYVMTGMKYNRKQYKIVYSIVAKEILYSTGSCADLLVLVDLLYYGIVLYGMCPSQHGT